MIRASWRRPSGPGAYQAGSSPPSPVFAEPPARWIPMVSAWWASGLSAPTLIAETTKRRMIERALSTSCEWGRDGRRSDPELVARDGAFGGGSCQRGPIAGERAVDVDRGALVAAGRQDLDLAGDPRREEVALAVGPEPGEPGVRQARLAPGRRLRDGQRRRPAADLPLGEVAQRRPAGPRRGGREAAGDDRGIEVDDVDQRPADVRGDRADPHPGERLAQAGLEGGHQAADGLGRGHRLGAARAGELGGQFDRHPRVDGGGPDRQDHRHGMDVEDVDRADREVRPTAKPGVRQRRMDRAGRQDRRDRQAVDRPAGIGQQEHLGAATRRRDGIGREPVERRGQAVGTGLRVPGRIERVDPRAAVADRGEQAGEVDHDRALEARGPWRTRRSAEQRGPATQLDPQVHDHALALRVDGRVGHLGERLAEVIRDRPVEAAAARGRRVVAHAPQRLVTLERHRLDVEPGALGVEAGEVAHDVVGRVAGRGRRTRLEPVLPDRSRGVVDRQVVQGPRLRLGVLQDGPPAGLDEEQLARPEPTASDRLGGREGHGAGLGGDGHEPVARHREGGRPEPVPIDERADPPAVGEDDRGRPVPRRQEAGRPSAERGDVRMGGAPERERLGDGGQQGRRQVPAGRGQELERLVERERVGAVLGQQRAGRQQRPGDLRGGRVGGAPADLLAVAADGVDLAVVGDRAERLGEPPDRSGVRRVALVEDRVADRQRRPQVRVEVGQPAADDQALVDDRPRGGGRDGQLGQGAARRAGRGLEPPPGDDEPALEGIVGDRAAAARGADGAGHDGMGEGRSRGRRRGAQGGDVDRDGAPGEDGQAGLGEGDLDEGACPCLGDPPAREEERDDPGPGRRQVAGQQRDERPIERQGDPGAVARLPVRPERAAVAERGQAGQRQRQDPIARAPAGVRHEPDAAGVMLEPPLVERGAGTAGAIAPIRVHGRCSGRGWAGRRRRGVDGGR